MKKNVFLFLTLAFLMSCNSKSAKKAHNFSNNDIQTENVEDFNSEYADSLTTDSTENETLNDIRFKDWTEQDWIENDYIRTLRKYIDDYNSGKIENPNLDPYKEKIKGKFVIGKIEPSLIGGLYIEFVFIDSPEKLFMTNVYSEVDEEKKIVTDYECRGVTVQEGETGFTKEIILKMLEKRPEYKPW